MGFLSKFLVLFSRGSAENRLKKGIDEAKAGKPEVAIAIYDALLDESADEDLRARALLNRALAYSALSDDGQAEHDLKAILANQRCPESVKATAREKLARVQKRMMRTKDRTKSRA